MYLHVAEENLNQIQHQYHHPPVKRKTISIFQLLKSATKAKLKVQKKQTFLTPILTGLLRMPSSKHRTASFVIRLTRRSAVSSSERLKYITHSKNASVKEFLTTRII